MSLQLPEHLTDFVAKLTSLHPPPTSIWVIGSRANGRATEESDTDLLVFGSQALLAAAIANLDQPQHIDCLIVHNGNDYQDPWQAKSGSLKKLKWQPIDSENARYIGVKWIPDEESSAEFGAEMGDMLERQERAIRTWP